ncbi:MAG: hypothetical protein O2820_05065 [Planctomycetota bacterium]|nr:hypothetical protein [Planctomycetota bacterium]MDA1248574.1 hypothetical protein [Planctomycetota bacterium]
MSSKVASPGLTSMRTTVSSFPMPGTRIMATRITVKTGMTGTSMIAAA